MTTIIEDIHHIATANLLPRVIDRILTKTDADTAVSKRLQINFRVGLGQDAICNTGHKPKRKSRKRQFQVELHLKDYISAFKT